MLLQTANSMSVITVPLLVTQSLHGTTRDVGLIFGLSAALEIPLMLGLGWAAGCFGYLHALLVSWLFGPLYFASMAAVTSTWQIAIARGLSAVYVAGLVGVAIAYFQGLLDEPGSRGAYVACLLLAAASTVLLVTGHLLPRRPPVPEAPRSDVR